jgi:DNA-binding NarL/FixJ family response regulator
MYASQPTASSQQARPSRSSRAAFWYKEVREKISPIDRAVKVLYTSDDNAAVLRAKGSAGPADCILKPGSPMDLLRTVRRTRDRNGMPTTESDALT